MSRYIDADKIIYSWQIDPDGQEHDGVTLQSIINKMPSIDAVPQWIPCNEMLPDGRLNKSYLVQDKDGRLAVGTYTNWGWMFGYYMNDPVAWMPLPEPYEAERKES